MKITIKLKDKDNVSIEIEKENDNKVKIGSPANPVKANTEDFSTYNNYIANRGDKRKKSKYRGVHQRSFKSELEAKINKNPWRACIKNNHKSEYLGMYETEEEAARAFDKRARELGRHKAYLNFPDE